MEKKQRIQQQNGNLLLSTLSFSFAPNAEDLSRRTIETENSAIPYPSPNRLHALASEFFIDSSELEKWNDLKNKMPVLIRILRLCREEDKPLTPSEISSQHAELVKQFIDSQRARADKRAMSRSTHCAFIK